MKLSRGWRAYEKQIRRMLLFLKKRKCVSQDEFDAEFDALITVRRPITQQDLDKGLRGAEVVQNVWREENMLKPVAMDMHTYIPPQQFPPVHFLWFLQGMVGEGLVLADRGRETKRMYYVLTHIGEEYLKCSSE